MNRKILWFLNKHIHSDLRMLCEGERGGGGRKKTSADERKMALQKLSNEPEANSIVEKTFQIFSRL